MRTPENIASTGEQLRVARLPFVLYFRHTRSAAVLYVVRTAVQLSGTYDTAYGLQVPFDCDSWQGGGGRSVSRIPFHIIIH